MSSKSETEPGAAGDESVTISVGGDGGVDLYLGGLSVLVGSVILGEEVVFVVVVAVAAVGVRMRFD